MGKARLCRGRGVAGPRVVPSYGDRGYLVVLMDLERLVFFSHNQLVLRSTYYTRFLNLHRIYYLHF